VNESDETLVRRSQGLDRAAFEELVRRTARMVFARLYLETGDVHRAEDLSQETYLIAWRSIHQVQDANGFRAWLLTIARTAATDAQRRERRKKRSGTKVDGEAAFLRLADPGADPAEAAEQTERRQQVLSLLRSLPEEYREPLMLRYITGADYETIGQQLGLSNGSLRGLLHRGMKRLREGIETKESGARSGQEKESGATSQ